MSVIELAKKREIKTTRNERLKMFTLLEKLNKHLYHGTNSNYGWLGVVLLNIIFTIVSTPILI